MILAILGIIYLIGYLGLFILFVTDKWNKFTLKDLAECIFLAGFSWLGIILFWSDIGKILDQIVLFDHEKKED